MMKSIKNKKGEGYIDVAVTIMMVSFVLVFVVNVVSLVALSQNLKTVTDQLVEYASQHGTTAIDAYAESLSEKTGIDFGYSFDGSTLYDSSGKVQLGDTIECTVTYKISFMGFGNAIHSVPLKASASGISRVYWK